MTVDGGEEQGKTLTVTILVTAKSKGRKDLQQVLLSIGLDRLWST